MIKMILFCQTPGLRSKIGYVSEMTRSYQIVMALRRMMARKMITKLAIKLRQEMNTLSMMEQPRSEMI